MLDRLLPCSPCSPNPRRRFGKHFAICSNWEKLCQGTKVDSLLLMEETFHMGVDRMQHLEQILHPIEVKEIHTKDVVISEHNEVDGMLTPERIPQPYEGQEFESEEAAISYYKDYAKMVGFGTRIRTRRSGVSVMLVCHREGEPSHHIEFKDFDKIVSSMYANCFFPS